MGDWITGLMEDYKNEPTAKRSSESGSQWLHDDYVKFIRLPST